MSDHDPFPNVSSKLTAPTKKSAFEKSRLEAEAKRLREEAETAAVYKDFVASFDEEPLHSLHGGGGGFGGNGPRGGGGFRGMRGGPPSGPGRRHFTGPPPSTRGGAVGPPGRKRNLDAAFERGDEEGGVFGGPGGLGEREKRRLREGNTGLLAFENSAPSGKSKDVYSDDSDSESSKPHPKPTLHLTSLPPSTTKPTLTHLLSPTALRIDSIRLIPAPPPPGPSQPSPSIRKAASALITLSPETPSSSIDSAITLLNGRYLGCGFWLSITRTLPSAVSAAPPSTPASNPFGAKAPPPPHHARGGLSRAPPPHRGGFAPPSSFSSAGPRISGLQVHVYPPTDLKVLRLIHKTIESVLTHGAEFEALLMGAESVKTDVKFSWLWDARSPEAVYYRWKMWEIVTGSTAAGRVAAVEVFEPSPQISAIWIPPKKGLKYEWAGSLKDVVEDDGFSSEELEDERDDSDREDAGERPVGLMAGEGRKGRGYLGVLERAKLVHLISRIPTQTSRVRRGDIGRVMAFAMEHAEGGMGEEVVAVLVGNVLKPLAFTKAAKAETDDDEEEKETKADEKEDYAAKIIGLWLISDILSNSSLGIRNAWRYRQLLDTALREKRVFAHLGDVYRTSGWGRMKAEKFRRGVVEGVLEWWEKWCIFPQSTQDTFLSTFLQPTTSVQDRSSAPATKPRSTTPVTAAPAAKSKWKTVDTKPEAFNPSFATAAITEDEDVDGVPMADDDDDDDDDNDVDGEPMVDEDVDGEPMVEDVDVDVDEAPEEEEMRDDDEEVVDEGLMEVFGEGNGNGNENDVEENTGMGLGLGMAGFKMGSGSTREGGGRGRGRGRGRGGSEGEGEGGSRGGAMSASGGGQRKRMRAEDMFADDDED